MTATTTQASTPDQLQAQLEDPTFLASLHEQGPQAIGSYMEAYNKAVQDQNNAPTAALTEEIKNEMQASLAEFLKDNKVNSVEAPALGASTGNPGSGSMLNLSKGGTGYNRRAQGASLNSTDYDAVDYIRAAFHDISKFGSDAARYNTLRNEIGEVMNSYTGNNPADGGLLVPEQMRSEIMQLSLESSVVRGRATVVPMSGGKVSFPVVRDDSHVSSVFGGVRAYWEDEAEAGTKSSAKFGKVVLEPKKIRALSVIPNDLLADAPALETFVAMSMPSAMAYYEDVAFIEGSGVGQPLGWKNADAVITVAKESGQAAGTIVSDNIFKMYSRMLPTSLGKAAWFANIDTLPQLAKLNVAVGTGGNTIWLPNAVQGVPSTLMGLPVIFTEKMETLGTSGDIMLADLSHYLIGDRQAITLSSSPHENFSTDETTYKTVGRVDGRPWLSKAITPKKGAAKLSPFVKLEDRS